jgi:hypothetical protein
MEGGHQPQQKGDICFVSPPHSNEPVSILLFVLIGLRANLNYSATLLLIATFMIHCLPNLSAIFTSCLALGSLLLDGVFRREQRPARLISLPDAPSERTGGRWPCNTLSFGVTTTADQRWRQPARETGLPRCFKKPNCHVSQNPPTGLLIWGKKKKNQRDWEIGRVRNERMMRAWDNWRREWKWKSERLVRLRQPRSPIMSHMRSHLFTCHICSVKSRYFCFNEEKRRWGQVMSESPSLGPNHQVWNSPATTVSGRREITVSDIGICHLLKKIIIFKIERKGRHHFRRK